MNSTDAGKSFQSVGGAAWRAQNGEVGWAGALTTMFPAEMRFNPAGNGELWIAQGVGVAKTAFTRTKYELTDRSAGIEELCAVSAVSVPGGKTFLTAWDKPFWSGPGYSTDGGTNWRQFEGTPQTSWGYGGCIAASTRDNYVLLPSNNGIGVYTLDGGKSWSPVRLDGSNPTGGFANAYYVARKNIVADKTRPGTFALIYTVMRNNAYDEPLGGVWLTRDGGRSWNQTLKGVVNDGDPNPAAVGAQAEENRQFWQCQLEFVPGRSGELVYTPHADFGSDRFFWSTDDGASWKELHSTIRNVTSFGFGKASSPQARPAVYFWGEVQRVLGLYVSFDWFSSTPLLLTRFSSQMLAKISCVAADPDRFGRAYVGTSCAGWIQVDIA